MDCQVRNIPLSKTTHSNTAGTHSVLFNSRGPGSSVHQGESCPLLADLKARRSEEFESFSLVRGGSAIKTHQESLNKAHYLCSILGP